MATEKGYYWVKFYNHEDILIMYFNGLDFEKFKSDKFIHDEIESYERVVKANNEPQALPMLDVSSQRELLFAVLEFAMPTNYTEMALNGIVDQFIKSKQ